ncbi:MAG: hypothetical protein LBH68_03525, partial [Bifidobacteriaceae bacterium]|nr:hypothetical protein [Bifidobacteriaceae bacterium]
LNWDEIDPQHEEESSQDDNTPRDEQLDCDDTAAKPKANDDQYGVRPGLSATLMVLSNDSATSCGALGIDRIDNLDAGAGHAEPILAGRAIQFTPAPGVTQTDFIYTMSDANGQTDSATVTITVVPEANQPPLAPKQELRLTMELGASATYQALTGFVDPEGDPLQLAAATTEDPALLVTYRPNGTVTIKDNGGGQRSGVTVALTVKDALGQTAQPVPLRVDFVAAGTLTPQADPVKADGLINQWVSLDLRETLRTFHVDPPVFTLDGQAPALTQIKVDPGTSTLTFKASAPNTYLLPLSLTSNSNSSKMAVRIDVREASEPRIVAVQDVAYVRPNTPTVIDPVLNDVAEGGGVKVMADFSLAPGAGIEVVPVTHQYLEITDSGGTGVEQIEYTVSANGVTAQGVIQVVHADAGANQDPVVSPKNLKVRSGGVVTIPVLERTFDPDGDTVQISTAAPIEPSPNCGRVYASGKSVRYQAPADGCPAAVTVSVPVLDDAGGSGLGSFVIQVHESQGGSKPPPEPQDLTARVLQGEEVRIAVPLVGIDVDGDEVSLLGGLDSQPMSGTVTEIGPDYITYRAGEDQAPGTDTFTYAVEDWASNRATATVQVGVSARFDNAVGVVARDDKATAKPTKTLDVPVFANDVDLSGSKDLTFCTDQEMGVSDPQLVVEQDLEANRLRITTPATPGQYQVTYFACSPSGNWDSAAVNVTVDPEAPVAAPKAKDIVSPPQDTIDKIAVDINVGQWAYNPSGPTSDLELFLPEESLEHAELKNQKEVTVNLQQELPTIVFYGLRNTAADAEGVTAYGSITVPPISRPPYLRPDPPPVKAVAGEETIINLDEYVAVTRGREGAFLYEPSVGGNLTASHANVKSAHGGQAISYTADRDYNGRDRIEFWVADTDDTDDASLKRSRLWLNVLVAPRGQSVLGYRDPSPQVERGGGSRTLDLAEFTTVDGRTPEDASRLSLDLGAPSIG